MPSPIFIESPSRLGAIVGTGRARLSGRGDLPRLSGAAVAIEERLAGATIAIESAGLSGLGDEASEMEETLRVATAIKNRKTIGIAGLAGGGLLLLSGLFSKGAVRWPTRVVGALGVGAGAWMLAKGVDAEGLFPWEKK